MTGEIKFSKKFLLYIYGILTILLYFIIFITIKIYIIYFNTKNNEEYDKEFNHIYNKRYKKYKKCVKFAKPLIKSIHIY